MIPAAKATVRNTPLVGKTLRQSSLRARSNLILIGTVDAEKRFLKRYAH